MIRSITFLLSLLSVLFLAGQQHHSSTEITQVDFTHNNELTSGDLSVFGIGLGMSQNEAMAAMDLHPELYYEEDNMHESGDFRIYVYDRMDNGASKNCILYLIWDNGQATLSSITFFEDFIFYLQGSSRDLLTLNAIDPESDIYRNYLGEPGYSEVTLDIPMIGLKHITYYYPSRGLEITHKRNSDGESVVFAFYAAE